MRQRIFVSGVQKELGEERRAVKNLIAESKELNDCFDVFLFEDMPAKGIKADAAYLKETTESDIYLGIFGNKYGFKGKDGVSATEKELKCFVKENPGKPVLIYIKGKDDSVREKEMQKLINAARKRYVCLRFVNAENLKVEVMKSLLSCMGESGKFSSEAFDERLCRGATFKDIEIKSIKDFLELRSSKTKVDKPTSSYEAVITNALKAAKRKDSIIVPTNAGILFFGKHPQEFIPQSEIRAARFKGTDRLQSIDTAGIQGSIYNILEQAERFFVRNTRMANKIVEFKRVDIPEYPYEAIREALINAIAHRDYTRTGAPVMLSIFDDRVEIYSPGGLMPGLKIKKLEGTHETRNKKICAIFHETKDMERFGTGIAKMNKLARQHGLKVPEFINDESGFKVIFYGPGESILDLADNIPANRQIDLKELDLNKRQIKVLALMVNDQETITVKKYIKLFPEITDKTAKRDIKGLVDAGMIKKVGFKKGAYFEAK